MKLLKSRQGAFVCRLQMCAVCREVFVLQCPGVLKKAFHLGDCCIRNGRGVLCLSAIISPKHSCHSVQATSQDSGFLMKTCVVRGELSFDCACAKALLMAPLIHFQLHTNMSSLCG